jgi:hypothetical protein
MRRSTCPMLVLGQQAPLELLPREREEQSVAVSPAAILAMDVHRSPERLHRSEGMNPAVGS